MNSNTFKRHQSVSSKKIHLQLPLECFQCAEFSQTLISMYRSGSRSSSTSWCSTVCITKHSYLVDLCQSVYSVTSRQHLHSASQGLLVVPRHRLSSYSRQAFSVTGPAIWNWLSDSLRDLAISRDSFKRSFLAYSCT